MAEAKEEDKGKAREKTPEIQAAPEIQVCDPGSTGIPTRGADNKCSL